MPTPSGRELAHSSPSAAATGPGTGQGAEQARPGVGVDPSLRLISPGSLPRTEVGMWAAPQQVGGETASALALSSSRRGPGGASAGWGHIEVVHGAALARSGGEE